MITHLRSSVRATWPLWVVIVIYLGLAVSHSLVAPLTAGNDEYDHFLYARFIREHGRLPINPAERQNRSEVGIKADDPPLYHLLVAAIGSGTAPNRVLRPVEGDPFRQLADNMVVSYAFIVHTGYELMPVKGEVQLWYVGRILSIFAGVLLVLLTYVTSRLLFPAHRQRALMAAALLAFWPAFIFHTSVMTYDGLGGMFTAVLLLVAIRAIQKPGQWRWWPFLGILAGLAVTTRYTSVLLPFEIVVVALLTWYLAPDFGQERPSPTTMIVRVATAGGAMVLASGWWFGFVIWHFNTIAENGWWVGLLEPIMAGAGSDTTATNITSFLFGAESISAAVPAPARARNYLELIVALIDSFWAARINEQYLFSPWLALLVTISATVGGFGLWRGSRSTTRVNRAWMVLLLFHALLILPLMLTRLVLSFDPLEAVQGRHILFPAATAIPILLVWGWRHIWPRFAQIMIVGLLWWSLAGQVAWAALVYPGPLPVWSQVNGFVPPQAMVLPPDIDNSYPDDSFSLTGASWQLSSTAPALAVTLWWQPDQRLQIDHLVELRLLAPSGEAVSFSVGHPVQGRYPTRAWETGDVVRDEHWLPVAAVVPGNYQLTLRLVDAQGQPVSDTISLGVVDITGTTAVETARCGVWVDGQPHYGSLLMQPLRLRQSLQVYSDKTPVLEPAGSPDSPLQMPLISENGLHTFIVGPDWGDRYRLLSDGQPCQKIDVAVPARDYARPEVPVAVDVNYNDELRLIGYDLPVRRIEAGGRLPLVLYWQALDTMGEDYQQFNNLLDQNQVRWGGYDRRAQDGYSTILWAPDEVIVDRFGVPVMPDAPPGVYTIDLGWYQQVEQGPVSLPLVADHQFTDQSSIRLGPVKVGGPPPKLVINNPHPQVRTNQHFAEHISLVGYDLLDDFDRPLTGLTQDVRALKLVLYWEATGRPADDYTVFLHLRDDANTTVAQKDQPPAGGQYPTSLWDAGEVIVDEHLLPLPELSDGDYQLVVGLYDFDTGARVSVENNPANELLLESITILP
jgi:hypothetical protein